MLTEKNKIVTEEKEPVRIFNEHYIKIVERSFGIKPTNAAKELEIEGNKKETASIDISFSPSNDNLNSTLKSLPKENKEKKEINFKN